MLKVPNHWQKLVSEYNILYLLYSLLILGVSDLFRIEFKTWKYRVPGCSCNVFTYMFILCSKQSTLHVCRKSHVVILFYLDLMTKQSFWLNPVSGYMEQSMTGPKIWHRLDFPWRWLAFCIFIKPGWKA